MPKYSKGKGKGKNGKGAKGNGKGDVEMGAAGYMGHDYWNYDYSNYSMYHPSLFAGDLGALTKPLTGCREAPNVGARAIFPRQLSRLSKILEPAAEHPCAGSQPAAQHPGAGSEAATSFPQTQACLQTMQGLCRGHPRVVEIQAHRDGEQICGVRG